MFFYIPTVYCFLPETAGRTLEAMDFLFASNSWFTWEEERVYREKMEELETRLQSRKVEEKEVAVAGKEQAESV